MDVTLRSPLTAQSQVRHGQRRRWLDGQWAEVKLHAATTVIVSVTLLFEEPRITLIVGGILCLFTYLYLGMREARKSSLVLTPLSFYFFWYSIGMGVSALYIGLTVAPNDAVRFASDATMVSLPDLATGYVLYLVGSFALHLGIQRFRPSVTQNSAIQPNRNFLVWLVVVWVVGLLFQLNPTTFSFLGAAARILAVAVVGSVCGFAVIDRKNVGLSFYGYLAMFMIGTAGLFFGNLASGSKAYIMFSFLPAFWLFVMNRRLRVWIPALALVLAVFYLALVAPVVQTSRRNPLEEGQNPREHLIESFETWNKEQPEGLDRSFLADQLDQFVNRQFEVVPVGFMVGQVAESGLLLGETMKYASYAFIPRLLWPDKPSVTRGAWFSTQLGLFDTEADATTSIGMTAVGELYWNFGSLGVIIGMLAIGSLQGLLWRMAGSDPRGKTVQMLLYVTIMLSMTDMPEAVTVFASIAVTFATFKAAFVVIELIQRRQNGQSSFRRRVILHP